MPPLPSRSTSVYPPMAPDSPVLSDMYRSSFLESPVSHGRSDASP